MVKNKNFDNTNNRIFFYSSVKTKRMFSIQKFYKTDICILKDLGYKVYLSNSVFDFLAFWKYDVAFIYFYRYGVIPAFFGKLFLKKVVFTGGIDYLDRDYAGYKSFTIQKIFFKLCNLFSDKNILVSNSDMTNIKKIGTKISSKKFPLSYHVIDFNAYNSVDIQKRKKVVCTIAWMLRVENATRKGVDKSILLFKEIYRNDPEYRMIIIGPKGEGTKYLQTIIKQEGLDDVITFTGAIDEESKIKILKESTIYTQLSVYEGFGIAAIEALAAGNLVVHTGKGGLADAIGNNGILIEREDYNNIYNKLQYVLTNKSLYKTMIENGNNHVSKKFKYDIRLNNFKHILQST